MVDASVLGISLQDGGNTPVLLLFPHNTRNILSIKVGALEAFAISAALSETDCPIVDEKEDNVLADDSKDNQTGETPELFSRPLVHQLLQKSIQSLGGSLIAVEVSVSEDQQLASTLVLQGPKGEERLECRPSDGISIAIRCGAGVKISPDMASQAEDLETVMPALSEDLRTIVAAKLLSLRDDAGLAPLRDSLLFSALKTTRGHIRKSMVEISRKLIKQSRAGGSLTALSGADPQAPAPTIEGAVKNYTAQAVAKREKAEPPAAKNSGLPAPRLQPQPPAQQQDEDDDDAATVEAVVVPGQTIVLPSPQGGGKSPTIRISLVRQGAEAEAEALDEQLFPSAGLSREALGSLSLSRDEVKAVGNARSEEDRLATLLRLLSPETKVPM